MSAVAALAGVAWRTANAPGHRRFRAALAAPEAAQKALLQRYLRGAAETAFGRAHGFARMRGVEDYQAGVPLRGYDAYRGWIERIAAGERRVLTRAPVRALELSSGSTAAAKRIPYTAELQQELRRAVAPWVCDLYRRRPRLALGAAYWSITPLALAQEAEPPARQGRGEPRTGAAEGSPDMGTAIRIGFEEDGDYLGGVLKRLVDATLAVPGEVRWVRDVESFRYLTLLFLLRRDDLALISVWHPSFLALLLEALPRHWSSLVEDIRRGGCRPPAPLPPALAARLSSRLAPRPRRAATLAGLAPEQRAQIWPRLELISCWGDAHAALHAEALRGLFPGVELQRKGLLATEAFVTVPYAGRTPLAIRSHFFEFLPQSGAAPGSAAGRARLAHELEPGEIYSVVVTTGGGLYRYRLEDRVEVDGFAGRTPSLRFLGKEDHVVDLCGEKLSEGFVAAAFQRAFAAAGIAPRFALLAPDPQPAPAYTAYLELTGEPPPGLRGVLERELTANPHFGHALRLGQLTLRLYHIDAQAYPLYLRRCAERGQRLGDVKPLALSPLAGWSDLFPGRYAAVPIPRDHKALRCGGGGLLEASIGSPPAPLDPLPTPPGGKGTPPPLAHGPISSS
ncbi:MAG TPA: GH3 auxin-responsive promoter family protein [Thermoanaerobaculia bacterium]|nr:GH3 auxin-responsive promoter family protein [Thermoanaerobaculia bacterium]